MIILLAQLHVLAPLPVVCVRIGCVLQNQIIKVAAAAIADQTCCEISGFRVEKVRLNCVFALFSQIWIKARQNQPHACWLLVFVAKICAKLPKKRSPSFLLHMYTHTLGACCVSSSLLLVVK